MARIKLAYLGGGSTRAAGTMASFIAPGAPTSTAPRSCSSTSTPSGSS